MSMTIILARLTAASPRRRLPPRPAADFGSARPALRRKVRKLAAAAAVAGLLGILAVGSIARAAEPPSVDDARATLRRATGFMREQVGAKGGYAWRYSPDLTMRRGEAIVGPTQGWVQPPGIPAVGTAFLQAYEATKDPYYLDAAREAGAMLLKTQLRSGGWWYMAEFDPQAALAWCYRLGPDCRDSPTARENGWRNASTLDDNTTQGALAFLIRLDRALPTPDPGLRQGIRYGLGKLIEAQYPNGAWPVRLDRKTDQEAPPAGAHGSYPDEWPRLYVRIGGHPFYTTNDHLMRDMIRLFLLAHRTYERKAYKKAARRGGEFLLAAQMPEPQPGWAQHYDTAMRPIWGRKFEPPAIASRETAGIIDVLLDLHLYTGGERWLAAADRAVPWLERSRLPDGEWARFYELETNAPLYMTKDYELTYADSDTPKHYGFKSSIAIPEALDRYHGFKAAGRKRYLAVNASTTLADKGNAAAELIPIVAASIEQLDAQGRWIDDDGLIQSATFIKRVQALAKYIALRDRRPLVTGDIVRELMGDS